MSIFESSVIWVPGMTLDELKKQVILKALQFSHGNKAAAANNLGIHVNTMTNQLEEYAKEDEVEKEKAKKNQEEAQRIVQHLRGNFTIDPKNGSAIFDPPTPIYPATQVPTEAVATSTPQHQVLAQKKTTVKMNRS